MSTPDLGDLESFDVNILQCEHCLGHISFSIAELLLLSMDCFVVLFHGLLGGWPWIWRPLGVLLLFPCHFGRCVQFTFWRSMHSRVRQSLSFRRRRRRQQWAPG